MPNKIKKLAEELTRRNVLRALGAYGIAVWLLAQGLVDLLPAIGLPDWAIRVFLVVAVGSTPLVAVIAWKYDLTSKGFLRDRQDVALERQNVLYEASGPTAASLPGRRDGRSILEASWTGADGEKIQRRFVAAFHIGRDYQAEIRLRDDCVSRRHVKVYPEGDDWYLKDLESLNGTYIGGQTVDIRKVGLDTVVSLDKQGPKVRLGVLMADDTLRSIDTL
jgi:hypothetical protein